MAPHRAAVFAFAFAFAIAMALAPAVVNSQAISPTVVISIQNNFPVYNLTVRCGSDVPAEVHPHVLLPKEVYTFHSSPVVEHIWVCELKTKKPGHFCGGIYLGEFVMWQGNDFAATAPYLCSTKCLWFVDASGLSLIRHPGAEPEHIYDWPTHAC